MIKKTQNAKIISIIQGIFAWCTLLISAEKNKSISSYKQKKRLYLIQSSPEKFLLLKYLLNIAHQFPVLEA